MAYCFAEQVKNCSAIVAYFIMTSFNFVNFAFNLPLPSIYYLAFLNSFAIKVVVARASCHSFIAFASDYLPRLMGLSTAFYIYFLYIFRCVLL